MGELPVNPDVLVDGFGRIHRDLRLSITDRCNLRCTYCMPEDFAAWTPHQELLTREELVRSVAVAVKCGVSSVRLTGGEPLLRADVIDIVSDIAELPNAPRISMTTNGVRLAELAGPLSDAGLARINISLDTLDRRRFTAMTMRDRLDDVLAGITAAQAAGLHPVKINTVLIRGVNEDEASTLVRHAIDQDWQLRFIEQMPLDAGGIWERSTMVTADEILEQLSREFTLDPLPDRGSAPAEQFLIDGGPATIGIIASVTRPFCGACDRLRITADGQVRNCLFARTETDLRSVLRDSSLSEAERDLQMARALGSAVLSKAPGHGINDPLFLQPTRPMSAIGG